MWSQLQTGAISPKPLILIGPGWQEVIEKFLAVFDAYVPEKHRHLLRFAPNVESAMRLLQ
jgi:predicted Rossmann-fold nucleotide-binding protein